MAFLVNTLVLQSDERGVDGDADADGARITQLDTPTSTSNPLLTALQSHGILSALVRAIASPLPAGPDGDAPPSDPDFFEKAVRALVAAAERGGLAAPQRAEAGAVWERWGGEGQWEEMGFSEEEGRRVRRVFSGEA